MLYVWVKISADNSLNYFSYFLQKVGFDIESRLWQFIQIVSKDNLYELSKPIFMEK